MKTKSLLKFCTRYSVLTIAISLTAIGLGACSSSNLFKKTVELSPEDEAIQYKFRGIYGGVLYFDASGYPKEHITMYNEKGNFWRSDIEIGKYSREMTYTESLYLPKAIRVLWRSHDSKQKRRPAQECIPLKDGQKQCIEPCGPEGCPDYSRMGWEGGTVLGDYTVPLATHIPDEVLNYIRANGGALRVKIRLKDNGVAVGWDVEKSVPIPNLPAGYVGVREAITYVMAGGDFKEARKTQYQNDPGWEN